MKSFIPPVLYLGLKKVLGKEIWSGDFSSWAEVMGECTGYSNEIILERHILATENVVRGDAAYERDTCLFFDEELNHPVVSSLLFAARGMSLRVLDFGGALGSTYFQNKKAFENLEVRWGVVEQEHFVRAGNERFRTDVLGFFKTLGDAKIELKPNVFFSSSTLQYLESPESWIEQILALKIPYLLFDRISFDSRGRKRLTKQTVPESIYPAEYPCWFFSEAEFLEWIKSDYDLIWEFESPDVADIPSFFKGFFFKRKQGLS